MLSKIAQYFFLIIVFLFVYSGLLKWINFGIDPTLFFGFLTLCFSPFFFSKNILKGGNGFRQAIVLFCILHVFFILTSIYAESEKYFIIKLSKISLNLIIFFIPLLTFKKIEHQKIIFRIAKYFCVAFLAFLAFQLYDNFLFKIKYIEEGDESIYPDYMSVSYLLGISILILRTERSHLNNLLILSCLIFMILLAAKGPLLFLFGIYILLDFSNLKINRIFSFKIFSRLLVIVLFVALSIYTPLFDSLFSRIFLFSGNLSDDESSMGRLLLFQKAFEIFLSNPFFGIGVGSFGQVLYGIDNRISPHNIFLEILVEAGIIGFLLFNIFLLSFAVAIRKYSKMYFNDKFFESLKLIVIYLFCSTLVASYLEDLRITYFWLGVLVAYLNVNRNNLIII